MIPNKIASNLRLLVTETFIRNIKRINFTLNQHTKVGKYS